MAHSEADPGKKPPPIEVDLRNPFTPPPGYRIRVNLGGGYQIITQEQTPSQKDSSGE